MEASGFIPYNSSLIVYAKENRKRPKATKAEELVWHCILKGKRMLWYKFIRQKVIDYFILDFYCAELMLGIEIDGWYHNDQTQAEYDEERTIRLNKLWITILRIKNEEVLQHLEEVKQYIQYHIQQLINKQ